MVREVRGRGCLLGIDDVDPLDGESMLDPALGVARTFDTEALRRGLIVYSTQPAVDGFACDRVLLAPRLVCTDQELDEVVARVAATVAAVEVEVEVKSKQTRERLPTARAMDQHSLA